MKLTNLLIEIASFLLIILFVYTGISKLIEHNKFQIVLYATGFFSKSQSHFFAYAVPVIECCIAFALMIPASRVAGLAVSTLLMGGFSLYIALMLLFAAKLPCACGGVMSSMTWHQHLIFNAAFTLMSFIAYFLSIRHQFFIAINRRSRIPV